MSTDWPVSNWTGLSSEHPVPILPTSKRQLHGLTTKWFESLAISTGTQLETIKHKRKWRTESSIPGEGKTKNSFHYFNLQFKESQNDRNNSKSATKTGTTMFQLQWLQLGQKCATVLPRVQTTWEALLTRSPIWWTSTMESAPTWNTRTSVKVFYTVWWMMV